MISAVTSGGNTLSEKDLKRLIDRYGDGLLRVCLMYLKDYALAEDAVQETFLRAYRSYDGFEGRSSEKTWLTAIAVNVCKNMLRSPWMKRNAGMDALEYLLAENPDMPDPAVAKAIMDLPKDMRIAVILFYVQGFKIREIAGILKIPAGTVSSRLNRARKKLHASLKEWYYEE